MLTWLDSLILAVAMVLGFAGLAGLIAGVILVVKFCDYAAGRIREDRPPDNRDIVLGGTLDDVIAVLTPDERSDSSSTSDTRSPNEPQKAGKWKVGRKP